MKVYAKSSQVFHTPAYYNGVRPDSCRGIYHPLVQHRPNQGRHSKVRSGGATGENLFFFALPRGGVWGEAPNIFFACRVAGVWGEAPGNLLLLVFLVASPPKTQAKMKILPKESQCD